MSFVQISFAFVLLKGDNKRQTVQNARKKKKKGRKQNGSELNCFRQPGYAKSLDGPGMRMPREVLTLCPLSYPCSALQSEGSTVTPKAMLRDYIDQITKPQLCFVFFKGGDVKSVFFFYFF